MSNEIYIRLCNPNGMMEMNEKSVCQYNFSSNTIELYCLKTNLPTIFMDNYLNKLDGSYYFCIFFFFFRRVLLFLFFLHSNLPYCGPTDENNLFLWCYKNVINAIFICMVLSGCEQRTANYYSVIAPIVALFRSHSACSKFPSFFLFYLIIQIFVAKYFAAFLTASWHTNDSFVVIVSENELNWFSG